MYFAAKNQSTMWASHRENMSWMSVGGCVSWGRWLEFVRRHPVEFAVVALLTLYFALDLTPSAYAYVLRDLGVTDNGLWLGEPSVFRSDEFSIWTPYTQAVVRNGFHRYNETSIYREDLRNFNALPLWDWAIVFKPQFWGFFLLPPDRAFSLYHTLLIGSCLIGWSAVFRSWAFPQSWAAAASLLFFFSGSTQFTWTTFGPLIAGFPFLLLAFCSRIGRLYKFLLLTWLITVWLLSHFYPPVFISLALTAPFLIGAFRPDTINLRNLGVAVPAFLIACLLVRLYFDAVFDVMTATVYPGSRSFPGGLLQWEQGLAHFFPFLTTRMDASIIGANAVEVTTASSYLPLIALIFLDWRNLIRKLRSSDPVDVSARRAICVLLAGLSFLAAWSFLPIPSNLGALLLLDKVQPQRMVYASGLLLVALSLLLLRTAGARWSAVRFLLLTSVVIAVWIRWKGEPAISPQDAFSGYGYWDATIIPAVALAGLWVWFRNCYPVVPLLLACLIVNIAGFGWINPLQSARPIFGEVNTPLIQAFRDMQRQDPRQWLVVSGVPGAALNGLGFRSVAHVLIAPQLAFFRPYFPQLSEAEFNTIFNRYAHIRLDFVDAPYSPANDAVVVPIAPFLSLDQAAEMVPDVTWKESPPAGSAPGGYADLQRIKYKEIRIVGWAMLDPADKGNRIIVVDSKPWQVLSATSTFRPDVANFLSDPGLLSSGVDLKLASTAPQADANSLQIFTVSPRYGLRRVSLPSP